jgi:hypothetical protein
MPNVLLFLCILTNAGGEGKTTLTLLVRALLDLAGRDSLALDADQGNWALKNRSGEHIATDLVGWNPRDGAAAKIVARSDRRTVLMDTGANMLAAGQPVGELVFELQKRFSDDGYRTAAFIPLSPNKAGAAVGANMLSNRIDGFDKFIVLNHRDKSHNFGEIDRTLAFIEVRHLASGLQAYLDQFGWRIAKLLTDPKTRSSRASAHVADWVRSFALEPSMRSLLTAEVCDLAASKLPPRPPRLRFAIDTLEDAADARIIENEHKTMVIDLIDRMGWSPAGLRAAADRLEASEARL